jgi:hypothetical protein
MCAFSLQYPFLNEANETRDRRQTIPRLMGRRQDHGVVVAPCRG